MLHYHMSKPAAITLIHSEQVQNKLNFEMLNGSLNLRRTAVNETTLISEIPSIIDEDNIPVAPEQGETPRSILRDDYCEELAFLYLFSQGKFGYKVKREVSNLPIKYFNQRPPNFAQTFASDTYFISLLDPLLNSIILNLQ